MASSGADSAWRALGSRTALVAVWLPLLAITALHYGTPPSEAWLHALARRLYYLPILGAAWAAGVRGGLSVAAVTIALYLPHAFTHLHHVDPGTSAEKVLEMAVYLLVGGLSGVLVDRERAERRRQEALATELGSTLEELRRTEGQLVRSSRLGALGQLTAGLAHEIRNPLHAMRGTADIVRRALEPGTAEREMQDLHLEEIDRLGGVLDRFLGFAKPSAPTRAEVDLSELVRSTLALVDAQARRAGVTVSAELGRDDRARLVLGDRDQLVQVILGVALNAVQALEDHDGPRRLAVRLSRAERADRAYHAIALTNSGPRIPEALLDDIFDPFVSGRSEGTGLGLSIAARIVDAHEGLVEVDNLDDGVEFRILLPVWWPAGEGS